MVGRRIEARSCTVRFSSSILVLFVVASVFVMASRAGNAFEACDTRQLSDKPIAPNAISIDLVVPFGYLCHHFEARGKEVAVQKAAYTSNATVSGPLAKGICNWRIDFVYYDTTGKEYMR